MDNFFVMILEKRKAKNISPQGITRGEGFSRRRVKKNISFKTYDSISRGMRQKKFLVTFWTALILTSNDISAKRGQEGR